MTSLPFGTYDTVLALPHFYIPNQPTTRQCYPLVRNTISLPIKQLPCFHYIFSIFANIRASPTSEYNLSGLTFPNSVRDLPVSHDSLTTDFPILATTRRPYIPISHMDISFLQSSHCSSTLLRYVLSTSFTLPIHLLLLQCRRSLSVTCYISCCTAHVPMFPCSIVSNIALPPLPLANNTPPLPSSQARDSRTPIFGAPTYSRLSERLCRLQAPYKHSSQPTRRHQTSPPTGHL